MPTLLTSQKINDICSNGEKKYAINSNGVNLFSNGTFSPISGTPIFDITKELSIDCTADGNTVICSGCISGIYVVYTYISGIFKQIISSQYTIYSCGISYDGKYYYVCQNSSLHIFNTSLISVGSYPFTANSNVTNIKIRTSKISYIAYCPSPESISLLLMINGTGIGKINCGNFSSFNIDSTGQYSTYAISSVNSQYNYMYAGQPFTASIVKYGSQNIAIAIYNTSGNTYLYYANYPENGSLTYYKVANNKAMSTNNSSTIQMPNNSTINNLYMSNNVLYILCDDGVYTF